MIAKEGVVSSSRTCLSGECAEESVRSARNIGGAGVSAEERIGATKRVAVSSIEAKERIESSLSVAARIRSEERVVAAVGNLSTCSQTDKKIVVWTSSADHESIPAK